MISITDKQYPFMLNCMVLGDRPKTLYTEGNTRLFDSYGVAFTGTTHPTALGYERTKRLARYLASHGYTIIAGLAKGIDQAAHEGALLAQGNTIAVLPHSLHRADFYVNEDLAQSILHNNGLLITEYETGKAEGARFLARNRITVALSLLCIPIQCEGSRSGTMATVRKAQRYARQIWVPHPIAEEIDEPQYEGIKSLIELKETHILPHAFNPATEMQTLLSTLKRLEEDCVNSPPYF